MGVVLWSCGLDAGFPVGFLLLGCVEVGHGFSINEVPIKYLLCFVELC